MIPVPGRSRNLELFLVEGCFDEIGGDHSLSLDEYWAPEVALVATLHQNPGRFLSDLQQKRDRDNNYVCRWKFSAESAATRSCDSVVSL